MKILVNILIWTALATLTLSSSIHQEELVLVESSPYGNANIAGNYKTFLKGGNTDLVHIAHTSALQAKSAVQSQKSAGHQAEIGAKNTFATFAVGAAKTAHAALAGKQAILGNLKRQLLEAQHQLQEEIEQFHKNKAAAEDAQEASHLTRSQLSALSAAIGATQASAQYASDVAAETASAEISQKAMVIEAKHRIDVILSQLKRAFSDVQNTEESAQVAAKAAHIARNNVARTGLKGSHFRAANGYY